MGWKVELPPRARRIRVGAVSAVGIDGTTSACAENTLRLRKSGAHHRNYLRVRGEYCVRLRAVRKQPELPPRARRIRTITGVTGHNLGTTSACAENTDGFMQQLAQKRNYLRVRGEYIARKIFHRPRQELPPRARRIPQFGCEQQTGRGTTSACAENTNGATHHPHHQWNYLRVRGEYVIMRPGLKLIVELPPRARRIQNCRKKSLGFIGTTSACAENTGGHADSGDCRGNYLRVRGEYPK